MRITSSTPKWPRVDPDRIAEKIRAIPASGKPTSLKRPQACCVCRRKIGTLSKALGGGRYTCDDDSCAMMGSGKLTALFPTPYGRAVTRTTVEHLGMMIEPVPGRVLLLRGPIVDRALAIAQGFEDLVLWQIAFDTYEQELDRRAYEEGRVSMLPPRSLEDVLVLRIKGEPVRIDPTRGLPADVREKLHALRTPF